MTLEQVKEVDASFQLVAGSVRRMVEIEKQVKDLLEQETRQPDKAEEIKKERGKLMIEHSQACINVRVPLLSFHAAIWFTEKRGLIQEYYEYVEKVSIEMDERNKQWNDQLMKSNEDLEKKFKEFQDMKLGNEETHS